MSGITLDVGLWEDDLAAVPAAARAAEAVGYGALWTSETQSNPMFPLVLAAEHTERILLGTAIAVAFARSPMDVATQAWDLARASRGRFVLGLGTQVKPHIERRFSMPWPDAPVSAFRDYIAALRAIWSAWQSGTRLRYRGSHYRHTLMAPMFDPGPIAHPDIPVYTAGVGPRMCALAGEVADGLHVHPFHSRRYLDETVLPAVAEGARRAGRSPADVALACTVFVAAGDDQAELDAAVEAVRRQLAFYASTPGYAAVMDTHGWSEACERLGRLAVRKRWDDMAVLVTDEMLDTFAVVGRWPEVGRRLREKYAGRLDRLALYGVRAGDRHPDRWRALRSELASGPADRTAEGRS